MDYLVRIVIPRFILVVALLLSSVFGRTGSRNLTNASQTSAGYSSPNLVDFAVHTHYYGRKQQDSLPRRLY
jgi:hypothetical protein